jgi:hypothetical protein
LRPDYLLFAIGTLGEPESTEMREHLVRGCPACTEGLRQARAVAYSMGALVSGPEAPRGVRSRVLAIPGPAAESRSNSARAQIWNLAGIRWQPGALAAACVVLALAPALWIRQSSEWRAKEAAGAAALAREQASAASLRQELARLSNEPVGALPIFALELERGAATPGEAPKQLAIPRAAVSIVLAVPTDLVRQASAVEIRNSSGQTVLTVSPLPASDADSTGLSIPTRLLPPGRYTVLLLARLQTLARFPFVVTLR